MQTAPGSDLPATVSPPIGLAPFAGLPVSDHFALIGLTQTRAKLGVLAHALLCKSPTHKMVEVEGKNWHIATFEDSVEELRVLAELVMILGTLRTAIVCVRGRYYAPGSKAMLYQWLVCLASKKAQNAPLTMCDYMTRGVYLLDPQERPHVFAMDARTGQVGSISEPSNHPRLKEQYRIPCHVLGSRIAGRLDRDSPASGREQIEYVGELEGLDQCPRYMADRMLRVR